MKAIVTKYHGPTDFKGARISASDSDGNRVIVSYDHASNAPHREAAKALCKKMNWHGWLIEGHGPGNIHVFIWKNGFDTFKV